MTLPPTSVQKTNSSTSTNDEDSDLSLPLVIIIVAACVVLIGCVCVVLIRRQKNQTSKVLGDLTTARRETLAREAEGRETSAAPDRRPRPNKQAAVSTVRWHMTRAMTCMLMGVLVPLRIFKHASAANRAQRLRVARLSVAWLVRVVWELPQLF